MADETRVLYSPSEPKGPSSRHILVAYVQNHSGVLSRVAGLFRRRRFNIESISAGHTEKPDVTRITIVADSDQVNTDQLKKQLFKLVEVIEIQEIDESESIVRENMLLKVDASGHKQEEVKKLASEFGATVAAITGEHLMIEMCDHPHQLDVFIKAMTPFGIKEQVRTGLAAMQKN